MSFAQKLAMSENEEKPQDPQVMYPVFATPWRWCPSVLDVNNYDV